MNEWIIRSDNLEKKSSRNTAKNIVACNIIVVYVYLFLSTYF
jgi:hypothetical protein